jgi:DNA-binding transcriptional MerR regulator
MARIYSGEDRLRLETIIKGKQLGFTLTEIAELIGSQDSGEDFEEKLQPARITTQIDHLERQRREIDDAISRLRALRGRMSGPGRIPESHGKFREEHREVDQFRKRASFDLGGSRSRHRVSRSAGMDNLHGEFQGNDQKCRGGAIPDKVSRPVP